MVTDAWPPLWPPIAPELERGLVWVAFRLLGTHLPIIASQLAVIVSQLTFQVMIVYPASLADSCNGMAEALTVFDNVTAPANVF